MDYWLCWFPNYNSTQLSHKKHLPVKLKEKILATLVTLAASTSSFAAASLSFQDVIFSTVAVDSDTLSFTITGANTASGDWAGVKYLKAFSFKDIGNITSATVVSGPSFKTIAESGKELNAKGCTGGSSGGACFTFTPAVKLTSSMTWTIDFVAAAGQTLDLSEPHLKVEFYKALADKKSTGSLLSQNLVAVTTVPEPESYALMLAGLGLVGAMVRRRKAKQPSIA